jgi:cyclase
MLAPRIIPSLFIVGSRLINTVNFKESRYLGDPLNAIRIFNEKQADEIAIFSSTPLNEARFQYLSKLSTACRMPVTYGGFIETLDQAKRLIDLGFEKVSFSTAVLYNPQLINEVSDIIGAQSVTITLNLKKNLFGSYSALSTRSKSSQSIVEVFQTLSNLSFGELILYSVNNDGTKRGYDLDTLKLVPSFMHSRVNIILMGGLDSYKTIESLASTHPSLAFGGTSLFVYTGHLDAVLINYNHPFLPFKSPSCAFQ